MNTATSTTVELLQRAVAELRRVANAASAGNWTRGDDDEEGGWVYNGMQGTSEYAVALTLPYSLRTAEDADYIALMHPPVALMLTAWLESAGSTILLWRQISGEAWVEEQIASPGTMLFAAVATARAILREES